MGGPALEAQRFTPIAAVEAYAAASARLFRHQPTKPIRPRPDLAPRSCRTSSDMSGMLGKAGGELFRNS
jgi:hypothetical protein